MSGNPFNSLVIVLISISIALIAFVIPFGYTYIKNLDGELSREFDEILKLLEKVKKKKSKESQIGEDIKNLNNKSKMAKDKIFKFGNNLRKGMKILFYIFVPNTAIGIWILLTSRFLNCALGAMIVFLIIEVIVLYYYLRILTVYTPMKELNELREKKSKLILQLQETDYGFISIFADPK